MTLHVVYNHQCEQCQAHYIPYDSDVPCPKCGTVEIERFDYIPQAAQSVRYNLERYGSYVPGAWWVGSLGDHILHILFHLYEGYRMLPEKPDFDVYVRDSLERMNWENQVFLRDHIYNIALRVRELVPQEPDADYSAQE